MKSILLFLISFLTCQTLFSQGIAVQGIARNAEKAALVDELLDFTFEIVGKEDGEVYYTENVEIKTDPYGVFSHIIGTGTVVGGDKFNEIPFSQFPMRLVISVEGDVISNKLFQYVPYAMSAANGVPTGTIVAFIGEESDVPKGWVLCDGRTLSNIKYSENLQNLVGSNVPDLQGMFLRGIGTSTVNQQDGPALMETQGDLLKGHSHEAGTLKTAKDGSHNHGLPHNGNGGNIYRSIVPKGVANDGSLEYARMVTATDGAHSHEIEGSTGETGGLETRPVNYGVNYIIKL